jgi:hypothetical protein
VTGLTLKCIAAGQAGKHKPEKKMGLKPDRRGHKKAKRHVVLSFGLAVIFQSSGALARDYVSTVRLDGGMIATITERDLNPSQFRITGCRDGSQCTINGVATVVPYGTTPATYLASIIVSAFGKTYNLPVSNMYGPLTGTRNQTTRTTGRTFGDHCDETDFCTFRAVFGDGSDVYAAQWESVGPIVKRTVLTADRDIFNWFFERIDPTYIE